jgi:hypothetical protein
MSGHVYCYHYTTCTKPGQWAVMCIVTITLPVQSQDNGRSCVLLPLHYLYNPGKRAVMCIVTITLPVQNEDNERSCVLLPLHYLYKARTKSGHGILPPSNRIWSPIPMVYRPPYPWYFDPLPISWLEMRGSKYHGVSIYHTRGSVFKKVGQNTKWYLSFLHSWPITGFVIRLTRRVLLVEQEQLTFPEHPSSVPVFSGACVTRSLVLCVCFVDHFLSCFAIVLSVLRFTDSYYLFRLWYLETLLKKSCYSFPNRLLC